MSFVSLASGRKATPVVVGIFSSSMVGWVAMVEELNQQQSTATTLSWVTTFRYALTDSAGMPRLSAATISILRPPRSPPAALISWAATWAPIRVLWPSKAPGRNAGPPPRA